MNTQDTMNPMDPHSGPGTSQPGTGSGFCQHCGLPLTAETRRTVAGAVFCEPCLAAKLAAGPGNAAYGASQPAGYPAFSSSSPLSGTRPNPVLAAVLGFIPGVGAMYNEQYAKGIAHLTIFALLVAMADSNGIFGLFVAGWEFYMAIEAHHTARARRDGTPLPNPFGFNDLGERLGFNKGWATAGFVPSSQNPAAPFQAATSSWSPEHPSSAQVTQAGVTMPNSGPPQGSWNQTAYTPFSNSVPYEDATNRPVQEGVDPLPASPWGRVPAGAIWLILLGILFLLSTTGMLRGFSGEALLGWGLIGFSGWLFLRRYHDLASAGLSPLGRISRSLQASVWLLTSGVLTLLDSFRILGWGRSWPIFLIVAGLLALVNRLAIQSDIAIAAVPPTSIQTITNTPR